MGVNWSTARTCSCRTGNRAPPVAERAGSAKAWSTSAFPAPLAVLAAGWWVVHWHRFCLFKFTLLVKENVL